jgi:mannose-6-phosphate isomerase-like protein (cupin superfamily)
MKIYIDIDDTICRTEGGYYPSAIPMIDRIEKNNKLFDEGNEIVYWTARGNNSGIDWREFTENQLKSWGVKYTELRMGKPSFDLLIDDKAISESSYYNKTGKTKKEQVEKVDKGWGHEIVFVNTPKYCGKILHFKKDAKFSMHFHIKKEETWFVASGRFLFRWIDTANADIYEEELNVGECITNHIGEPHQIICLEEGDIFEVSTQHFDNDSYRVMKGDSQKLL